MGESSAMPVEAFYRYGYQGRDMMAIRSPIATTTDAELVGRRIRVGERVFCVRAVSRQISGPIQKGEPIGVEVEDGAEAVQPE